MKKRLFKLEEYNDNENFSINDYTHLRAYHACRPAVIESYLENGIIPLSKENAKKEAIIKLSNKYSVKQIETVFEQQWNYYKPMLKKVYLQLNKDLFVDEAGHYLIYGSEFISGLAVELGSIESLKQIGVPTIFTCDIPINDISKELLKDVENCLKYYNGDISIWIPHVKPEYIVKYEYPNKIYNPIIKEWYFSTSD